MPVFQDLWNSVPPITRTILLISILLTVSVSLDLCTPFKLYFNYNLIKRKYQVSPLSNSLVLAHLHELVLLRRILSRPDLRLLHPVPVLEHA